MSNLRHTVGNQGLVFYNSSSCPNFADKNENNIFLIYSEIQSGAVAKPYMRKGFLIYEEAVSHI
jgi:hypothetical protein